MKNPILYFKIYGLAFFGIAFRRLFYLLKDKTQFSFALAKLSMTTVSASSRRAPSVMAEKYTLIIVHHNPFTALGGVEHETRTLMKRLGHNHGNLPMLVYYFDTIDKNFFLSIVAHAKVRQIIKFENLNAEDILAWLIKNYQIKIALIEHLLNHSFAYIKILADQGIPTLFFVHDFYPLFKIPHTLEATVPPDLRDWWRALLGHTNVSIIFNSEFTLKEYQKRLNFEADERILISYPL